MGRDYYEILGVHRAATDTEIRSGYKWQAMKWHPQKNPAAKVESEQRFREVAEAFDVLIDPVRRQRFNEVGEHGLKHPAPGSGKQPYQYVGDPYELFVSFFADANPLASAYADDKESIHTRISAKTLEKPIEIEVQCSLQELLEGGQKGIPVERTRIGPGNVPYTETKTITLPMQGGWESGTRVTFKGEGNHTAADKSPGDLIFILKQSSFPNVVSKDTSA